MSENEMKLEDLQRLKDEFLFKKVIGFSGVWDASGDRMVATNMDTDDFKSYRVEMTDYDCCASAWGNFVATDFNSLLDFESFEGVITDVKLYEGTHNGGYETERFAEITLLFEDNRSININMGADNGNGDYYMSVATLIVKEVKSDGMYDRHVYDLHSN